MTAETHAVLIRALLARLADRDRKRAAHAVIEHADGLALARVVGMGYVRRVSPTGRALLARTHATLSALLDERPAR